MASLQRAIEVKRTEGTGSLMRKGGITVRHRVRDAYWRLRGTRTIERAGVSATFSIPTMGDARTLEGLLRLESPMLEDLLSNLRSHDVFYDVGAHIGLYTCLAVNRLPDENVVAFEPNPDNLAKLRNNLRYNGSPRVRGIALSNESGTVEFDNPSIDREEWSGKGSIASDPGDESITVEAHTGTTIVERDKLTPPTVAKIDVEGAEPLVIEGMADLLESDRCRLVYCEVHREAKGRRSVESYGSTPAAVKQMLKSLDFTIECLDERPAEFLLKGTKETG